MVLVAIAAGDATVKAIDVTTGWHTAVSLFGSELASTMRYQLLPGKTVEYAYKRVFADALLKLGVGRERAKCIIANLSVNGAWALINKFNVLRR